MQRWRRKLEAFRYYLGDHPLTPALLRWAAWGIRCALGAPAVVTLPRLDMRLQLAPRWRGCWKPIFVFRERFFDVANPELAFLRDLLSPGDVFVDAGAYHGWYAVVASRAVGMTGRVLAFEPNPESFDILARNIALNGCRNIKAFAVALSDRNGEAWLTVSRDDGVASSLGRLPEGMGRVRVPIRRLDDVVRDLGTPRVALLKVDVEGAEGQLLRGAAATLTASRPVVIFEVNPRASASVGVAETEAWDVLVGMGYRFFTLSTGTPVELREFPDVAPGTVLNVIAAHREATAPWAAREG